MSKESVKHEEKSSFEVRSPDKSGQARPEQTRFLLQIRCWVTNLIGGDVVDVVNFSH